MSVAQPAPRPTSRVERGMALYRAHGKEIRHLHGAIYRVPSQDGQHSYDLEYGERESCSCPDFLCRGGSCVHLYALGIATAKGSIQHPQLAAGDPFIAGARNRPCGCNSG